MAHILAGTWRSHTIISGTIANDTLGDISLVIDAGTGDLITGSTQNGHPLTGSVKKNGRFLTIEIINAQDRRKYEGVFSADHSPGGVTDISLDGRVTLNFVPSLGLRDETSSDRSKADEKSARFEQEQAIWVAHKP